MKRAILLSSCGMTALELAKGLIIPEDLKMVLYKMLVAMLNKHFTPQPTQLAQRVTFFNCLRKPQKPATVYLAKLCWLACRWLLDQFTHCWTNLHADKQTQS